jgi:hypothetical protein
MLQVHLFLLLLLLSFFLFQGVPMHPELLRALGNARHEDLLNPYRSRRQPRIRLNDQSPRFTRLRQRVGSRLIWAGERLTGDRPAAVELAHK